MPMTTAMASLPACFWSHVDQPRGAHRFTSPTASRKANVHALDKLKEQGVSLVIAVGCGVRAHREAKHAHSLGLDLIITDHHELETGSLPDALAVIDPKQPDCPYQFARLAGVGVASRSAQCPLRMARVAGLPTNGATEASLLDLVALGMVADTGWRGPHPGAGWPGKAQSRPAAGPSTLDPGCWLAHWHGGRHARCLRAGAALERG